MPEIGAPFLHLFQCPPGEGGHNILEIFLACFGGLFSDFPFPLQPPTPHHPDKPPGRPTPESLISVHFGSVWVLFGCVSGPFWVHFGVLGGVGVRSGRGASVREKNITRFVTVVS